MRIADTPPWELGDDTWHHPPHLEGVYFVRCGNFVKIGKTKSPKTRLDTLQSSNPYPLHMGFWTTPSDDGHLTEPEYHDKYADYRHTGEWFRVEGDLAGFLDDNWNPGDNCPCDQHRARLRVPDTGRCMLCNVGLFESYNNVYLLVDGGAEAVCEDCGWEMSDRAHDDEQVMECWVELLSRSQYA